MKQTTTIKKRGIYFKQNCINYKGHPIISLPGKYEDYKDICLTIHITVNSEESSPEEREQYLRREILDIITGNIPYIKNIDEKTPHKKSLWERIKEFLL